MRRLAFVLTYLVSTLTGGMLAAQPLADDEGEADAPAGAASPANSTAPVPLSRAVSGDPGAEGRIRLSLARCLSLAVTNYPKVREAQARLAGKRTQITQARYAPFSEFTVTSGVGLAPTVRGTSIFSPDTDRSLSSNMALAWQTSLEGALPLYTFGKLSAANDAAEAQVTVGEHEVKKEQNDVRLNVRRAYYGVLLSREALGLLREAGSRVEVYVTRMTKEVASGEGDDIQLLRLRIHRADLAARQSEAERNEAVALASLRFLTGVETPIDIADRALVPIRHTLGPLTNYLAAARLFRPEANMARAGVVARRALMRLEKARLFPDLGLGMNVRWSYAPEVTDQTNPFVRDSANYLLYGLGVALRYKLDVIPQVARLSQSQAQLDEMLATERYALGGIGQQVEEVFAEVQDYKRRLEATSDAARMAQQWLIKVQQGIDVGVLEDSDLVDPAKEYALKRFAQLSATYEYNVALSKLAQTTGWDAILTGD